MRAHTHYRAVLLCLAALATLFTATPAFADDCPALLGILSGGECRVAAPVTASGNLSVATTLRILDTGRIDVPPGSTLTLTVGGDLILDPGGEIVGDATAPSDVGATLAITVGGDVLLDGDGIAGGMISADGPPTTCAPPGQAGAVSLTSTGGVILVEAGARIQVNSSCRAGSIVLTTLDGDVVIGGFLEAAGGVNGDVARGGPITVNAAADLTVEPTGRISSRGVAVGADRVHLESGLDTVVTGLVESLGGAATTGLPNGCDAAARAGKPASATGCIEVWAGATIAIDASALGSTALAAAAGASGTAGVCCTWVDLFARGDITVLGSSADRAPFAVSARQASDGAAGGQITVKSVRGKVTTQGRAFQSTAINGTGGPVVIEAGGPTVYPPDPVHPSDPASDVTLNDVYIEAFGGMVGGSIAIRSFNGALTGGPAAFLDASGGSPGGGVHSVTCGAVDFQGTALPSLTTATGVCGGAPSLPPFVGLPAFKPRPTIVVTGGTFVFDGNPHPATGTVTGTQGEPLTPLTFAYFTAAGTPLAGPPVDVGSYTAVGSFPGNAAYRPASATAAIDIVPVTAPTPVIVITANGPFVYDGLPHPALGIVVGIGGVTIGVPTFTYDGVSAAPVTPGTSAVLATFPGDSVYKPAAPVTTALTITKAPPTLVLSGGGSLTYDGNAHIVTGVALGVAGETLSPPVTIAYTGPTSGGLPLGAGTYLATGSFAGNANYLARNASTTLVITRATPTVTVASATVPFDGLPHTLGVTVTGAGNPAESLPAGAVTFTYNGSPSAPSAPGVYTVVATFPAGGNYTSATGTGTLTITPDTPSPTPDEACLSVDFREITYFREHRVLMSSDAGIRARNGIKGGFNPGVWPYDPKGRGDSTKSRGTLFRIYGFAADQVGVRVPDADDPTRSYPVRSDPDIPGARYADLGRPARVIVCVAQLQHDLIDESSTKKPGVLPGTRVLTDAQRNVPGIMLNHNAAVIDVPKPVREDLRDLGTPLVDRYGRPVDQGIVDYVGFQLWGHGAERYREFVDVEITFLGDDPDDLAAHYAVGFHTAKNVNVETFPGCNYLDATPGNDGARFHDVWSGKHAGDPDYGPPCGRREPAGNQRVRANYEVPFGAVQLLFSVNTADDTVRLFFGEIRPYSSR